MRAIGRITTVFLFLGAVAIVVAGVSSRKDVGRYLKMRSM
jgi:hypothetical protein